MVVYVGVGAMRVEHPIIMEAIGSWFDGCPDLLPRGLRVICCHVAFHFDEAGGRGSSTVSDSSIINLALCELGMGTCLLVSLW